MLSYCDFEFVSRKLYQWAIYNWQAHHYSHLVHRMLICTISFRLSLINSLDWSSIRLVGLISFGNSFIYEIFIISRNFYTIKLIIDENITHFLDHFIVNVRLNFFILLFELFLIFIIFPRFANFSIIISNFLLIFSYK